MLSWIPFVIRLIPILILVWRGEMKKGTKIFVAGAVAILAIAAAITAKKYVSVDRDGRSISIIGGADGPTSIFLAGKLSGEDENEEEYENEYISITMEEAKMIFEVPGDYVIVDVRTADEFSQGHIPGAINIANETITDEEPKELPDKNQTIYVYCRSGNRSKQASAKLAAMGYADVIECGGILDWTGELEK